MLTHLLILSATSFFESTMAGNIHTHEVREAFDDFSPDPNTPLYRSYGRGLLSGPPSWGRRSNNPHLSHLEGGYLVASLLREGDPATLTLLGHMDSGHLYVAVSLMRDGDSMNLPLQVATTQGFP